MSRAASRPRPEAARAAGEGVEVRTVHGRADLARFIDLQWRIYADDPNWVAPLRMDVRALLDRAKHPFHKHAEVELMLAWRNGQVVGRIAAIVNHLHNDFHDDRVGFFGLFECIDDSDVAAPLLAAAEAWLAARGMESARGPVNLSTNDELYSPGILIDGFDTPPTIMMAHTPPYYRGLLEKAGYLKARDLFAYWVDVPPPPRLVRMYERLVRSPGVTIRGLHMKQLEAEVGAIQTIYNSAWEKNWGFVPMTPDEITHLAAALKPVVNPDLCGLAYVNDEPVGFALGLPEYNQALRHVNGRLLPFGIFKLLWHRRRINAIRVLTLGLKPAFRQRGFDAALITHIFIHAGKRNQARGECSWILEDNVEMRNSLERLGGVAYKTYRVYEKSF